MAMDSIHRRGDHRDMAGHLDVKVCWYQCFLVNLTAILEQSIHKRRSPRKARNCRKLRSGRRRDSSLQIDRFSDKIVKALIHCQVSQFGTGLASSR
jgi:hypothetical protein